MFCDRLMGPRGSGLGDFPPGNPVSAGVVSTSYEGHPRRGNRVLTDSQPSLDSSFTASSPGRASHRRPLRQHAPGAAPCRVEAGRTVGVWSTRTASEAARRRARAPQGAPPTPSPFPKDRLEMLTKFGSWSRLASSAGGVQGEVSPRWAGEQGAAPRCPSR